MIDDPLGRIDYDETGTGPTVVLVPGSCSTGAAWRPMMAEWQGKFRCVTTSLLGYGGTAERRTPEDPSITFEAEVVEAVVRRAGGPVHLVGHSFGGLVSVAVAVRRNVRLASLSVVEAPAATLLAHLGEAEHHATFQRMTDIYFAAFERSDPEAVAIMIDFYGGAGTFASWPPRVRAYAADTTHVNILDWASGYGYAPPLDALADMDVPALILWGGASPSAVQRANERLSMCTRGAAGLCIPGAAHFMIATHATGVARVLAQHIDQAERSRR